MTTQKTFTQSFEERIKALEAEAKEIGLNFTSICKEAGISRATPDRWKRSTPKTVKTVSTMEAIVARKKAEIENARLPAALRK